MGGTENSIKLRSSPRYAQPYCSRHVDPSRCIANVSSRDVQCLGKQPAWGSFARFFSTQSPKEPCPVCSHSLRPAQKRLCCSLCIPNSSRYHKTTDSIQNPTICCIPGVLGVCFALKQNHISDAGEREGLRFFDPADLRKANPTLGLLFTRDPLAALVTISYSFGHAWHATFTFDYTSYYYYIISPCSSFFLSPCQTILV